MRLHFFCVLFGRGRNEQRKEERRKEGTKRGDTPPFFELFATKLGLFFSSILVYIFLSFYYITFHCFDVNSITLSWAFSRHAALFYLSFCFPWVRWSKVTVWYEIGISGTARIFCSCTNKLT